MARVQIDLNHHGMAELLKSFGVRAELVRRADRVAAVAQAGAPQHDIQVTQTTHDRAIVRVENASEDGMRYEADHGTLVRALHEAGGRS
jgi:hypothetical protein